MAGSNLPPWGGWQGRGRPPWGSRTWGPCPSGGWGTVTGPQRIDTLEGVVTVGASFGGMTPTPARAQPQDLHLPCPGGQGIPLIASGEDLGGSAPTSPEHTALRQSGSAAWTLQQL